MFDLGHFSAHFDWSNCMSCVQGYIVLLSDDMHANCVLVYVFHDYSAMADVSRYLR